MSNDTNSPYKWLDQMGDIFKWLAPTGNWAYQGTNSLRGTPGETPGQKIDQLFANAEVTGKADDEPNELSELDRLTLGQKFAERNMGLTEAMMGRIFGQQQDGTMEQLRFMMPFAQAENQAERDLRWDMANLDDGTKRFLGQLGSDDVRYVTDSDNALARYQTDKEFDLGMAGLQNTLAQQKLINAGQLADTNAMGEWTVANTRAQNEGLLGVADIEAGAQRYQWDRRKEIEELNAIYSMFDNANRVSLT